MLRLKLNQIYDRVLENLQNATPEIKALALDALDIKLCAKGTDNVEIQGVIPLSTGDNNRLTLEPANSTSAPLGGVRPQADRPHFPLSLATSVVLNHHQTGETANVGCSSVGTESDGSPIVVVAQTRAGENPVYRLSGGEVHCRKVPHVD